MRRALIWLVTLPFAAASILLGHAIAYSATGMPLGDVHGYLEHVPQVVFVLASVAVLGLAVDTRARRRSPAPIAGVAVTGFIVQEHLERLIHTGHLPFLLTSPVLWLGILLQLPLAAVIWLVCRRLADDIAAPVRRLPPRLASLPLVLGRTRSALCARLPWSVAPARGPPVPS